MERLQRQLTFSPAVPTQDASFGIAPGRQAYRPPRSSGGEPQPGCSCREVEEPTVPGFVSSGTTGPKPMGRYSARADCRSGCQHLIECWDSFQRFLQQSQRIWPLARFAQIRVKAVDQRSRIRRQGSGNRDSGSSTADENERSTDSTHRLFAFVLVVSHEPLDPHGCERCIRRWIGRDHFGHTAKVSLPARRG
jgi:hypothetical protein